MMCAAWPFFYGLLSDKFVFEEAKAICPGLNNWDWERFKIAAPKDPPLSFKKRLKALEGLNELKKLT
jgi:hypothetical protein